MGGPPTGLSRRTEDLPARPSGDRHEVGPARPGERNTSFHPELPQDSRGYTSCPPFSTVRSGKGYFLR